MISKDDNITYVWNESIVEEKAIRLIGESNLKANILRDSILLNYFTL